MNMSSSLVKYSVTFGNFSVISVISGISGDSEESTWPTIFSYNFKLQYSDTPGVVLAEEQPYIR